MTAAGPPPADLVLRGGQVLTFADWSPGAAPGSATAVAVRDGVVVAVGHELSEWVGPGTEVVELAGRAVIPGVSDTHLHLVCAAMAEFGLLDVSARAIGSWAGLDAVLTAEAIGADGWIRARGWDAGELGAPASRALVDESLSRAGIDGVPVALFDRTGHQLLLGSAALVALGIDRDVADPQGGVVEREADGAPSGVLTDSATALAVRRMPPVPAAALRDALLQMQRRLLALGITAVTDPGIGPGGATLFDGSASPSALAVLRALAEDGLLTLRTSVLLTFAGTGGESTATIDAGLAADLIHAFDGTDPALLRIVGVKVFADGIQRSGTSFHRAPYGPAGARGRLAVDGPDDEARLTMLRAVLARIEQAGLQAGVHATGDAAADAVVDALATLHPARLPYVIHGDFLPAEGMTRLAETGIGWTANPVVSRMVAGIGRELLGAARQELRQPLAAALQAGVTVTLSSDAPVVDPDWREAVIAATLREQVDGAPRPGDPQGIPSTDALAMMTVLAARLDGMDHRRGRLVEGFDADLVVLAAPWPEDVTDLRAIPADLTVLAGRVVHRRDDAADHQPRRPSR